MQYLLGIDLGTSGTKTVLFDLEGKAIAQAVAEYPLDQPQNGWAEQDPDSWWSACVKTVGEVLGKSGIHPEDIAGIGLSGQMHGLVMLDENGQSLRPSILWCDSRTEAECAEITEKIGAKRLIEITANPALPGFTAGKILWVRRHEPEVYAKCRHILLPKDYLRYKLTGVFATEVSDASGMNLLDVPGRCWSAEILQKLDIAENLLPTVHESITVTGKVTPEAAGLTGLAPGTPVVGGAGDNAAAAVGTGVVEKGKAFTTIGTSGVIFAHADAVSIDPLGRVHTFCSAVPGKWTVMSCTLSAGLSLQWFRNQFCGEEVAKAKTLGIDPYTILAEAAAKVPIGANRLLFLPYLMGERSPLLDSNARGVFFGLSAKHTKPDLVRAVMEGVSFSLLSCLEVLGEMGICPGEMLATGGGGTSPLWRQMLADLFNVPVTTVINREGPALGAAILAGVGVGLYPSVEEACAKLIQKNQSQSPIPSNSQAYDPYYALYLSLYPAMKAGFASLATL